MSPHLTDYIRVYYGTLVTPEESEALITRFEGATEHHEPIQHGDLAFTQLNVTRHWPTVSAQLSERFLTIAYEYKRDLDVRYWPDQLALEALRLKRYQNNGLDQFPPHVDVVSHASARRYLVMFAYLNDVTLGGETAFPQWNVNVHPEQGKVLCFPPHWQYPHEGRPPITGPKYLLSTYLHLQ